MTPPLTAALQPITSFVLCSQVSRVPNNTMTVNRGPRCKETQTQSPIPSTPKQLRRRAQHHCCHPPSSSPQRCHSLRGAHPPHDNFVSSVFDTCPELTSLRVAPQRCSFLRLINPSREGFKCGKSAARGKLRHSAMGRRSMGNWARRKAV